MRSYILDSSWIYFADNFHCIHGREMYRKAIRTQRLSGKNTPLLQTQSNDVEYLIQLYETANKNMVPLALLHLMLLVGMRHWWCMGPISQMYHKLLPKILWKFILLSPGQNDQNQKKIVHIARQLSCRGIFKVVTWCLHCKNYAYCLKKLRLWDYKSFVKRVLGQRSITLYLFMIITLYCPKP